MFNLNSTHYNAELLYNPQNVVMIEHDKYTRGDNRGEIIPDCYRVHMTNGIVHQVITDKDFNLEDMAAETRIPGTEFLLYDDPSFPVKKRPGKGNKTEYKKTLVNMNQVCLVRPHETDEDAKIFHFTTNVKRVFYLAIDDSDLLTDKPKQRKAEKADTRKAAA